MGCDNMDHKPWDMLTDAEGNLGSAIRLRNEASKGRSGRVSPLNRNLREALQELSPSSRRLVPTSSPQSGRRERLPRGDREPVRGLVPHVGISGLLQSLWPADLHHRRCQEDLNGRRLAEGRADAGRSRGLEHDPALIEADVEAQRKVVDLI